MSTTLTASGGSLISASSVSLAVFLGPSLVSSVNPSSIQNPSTGLYYYDLDVTTPGEHIARWRSYGSHVSESYNSFLVNSTMFS